MAAPLFEIYPATQSYDWGVLGKDGSKVAQYAQGLPNFDYDPSKPYAEVRSYCVYCVWVVV
jgi:mannose-6-phosphate isomerase